MIAQILGGRECALLVVTMAAGTRPEWMSKTMPDAPDQNANEWRPVRHCPVGGRGPPRPPVVCAGGRRRRWVGEAGPGPPVRRALLCILAVGVPQEGPLLLPDAGALHAGPTQGRGSQRGPIPARRPGVAGPARRPAGRIMASKLDGLDDNVHLCAAELRSLMGPDFVYSCGSLRGTSLRGVSL